MLFSIRKLIAADVEAYSALRMRALREHPEAFLISPGEEDDLDGQRARLAKMERGSDNLILGAFERDTLVATTGVFRYMANRAKGRHKAMIWDVYVAPRARRKGVARALLDRAIEAARAMDHITVIQLAVVPGSPARALYAAAGFETSGFEKRAMLLDGKYIDDEMMALLL